jgi:hypothetical protein
MTKYFVRPFAPDWPPNVRRAEGFGPTPYRFRRPAIVRPFEDTVTVFAMLRARES